MAELPRESLDIYCIAIGGTGMAPLACLLREAGHRVRGSDGPLYPPMSTLLAEAGIEVYEGFDPIHLEPPPDLVVVGNAVPRQNVEASAAEALGLPLASMPQMLARFFLGDRDPLVVAGTHGKTTTTAMTAWVYSRCGADPGFLVGGLPLDIGKSFRRGDGRRFILEGDEYNASYFDRGAKFLHYRPETLILTSAEYDHADLYSEPAALRRAYAELIHGLPSGGLLIACGDAADVRSLSREAPCRVVLYGIGEDNDVRARRIRNLETVVRVEVETTDGEEATFDLALWGEHNVCNALAVWSAARADGLDGAAVAAALAGFHGVRRRLELLGEVGGIAVIDDFAHHPSAVAASVKALRSRYPGRRLVVLFEPRSLTAGRQMFFDAYLEAFRGSDRVHLAPIFHARRLAEDERLDLEGLCTALQSLGVEATAHGSIDALLDAALEEARPGDVLVTMSSGSFSGLPGRLLEACSGDGNAP